MRLDPFPRFPESVGQLAEKLTLLFRDAAQQVNAAADGQIVASNNARTSIPTTGTYAKGDFVRKSAPSVSSSGIVVGWLRISDGSAHVLNTDWVECIVPTVNFLPLAGGTISGDLVVNGKVQFGSTSATAYGALIYKNGADATLHVRQDGSGRIVTWNKSGSDLAYIDTNGNLVQTVNGTAPTLGANGQMTFELTSNTELKIKVRGSDGTTRSVSLTLA